MASGLGFGVKGFELRAQGLRIRDRHLDGAITSSKQASSKRQKNQHSG